MDVGYVDAQQAVLGIFQVIRLDLYLNRCLIPYIDKKRGMRVSPALSCVRCSEKLERVRDGVRRSQAFLCQLGSLGARKGAICRF